MARRPVRAVALVAALACLAPVQSARAQEPAATPGSQPPLTEDPPQPLDGGEPEPTPTPTATATATPGGGGSEELPDTGAESALVALTGLGLLAAGAGLRVSVPRHGG